MNKFKKFTTLERATSVIVSAVVALLPILILNYSPSAQAGWSVNVGYSGSGTVTVKISNPNGTNVAKTSFTANPSAAIPPEAGYTATAALPPGASPETYARVQALSAYRTTIQSYNGPGDQGDGEQTMQLVIPRSACASSDVNVYPLQITLTNITFHYSAKLSDEGSAVLLQVLDAVTGQQKYVVLLTGPSDNTGNNCEGTFTVNGDPTRLNLVLDGSTSTLPFSVACPPDMVFGCGAPLPDAYFPPAVATGVTGPFTYTYNPIPSQLLPGTNTVTVTARDTNGCTTRCQFKVVRQTMGFDGFFSPIGGADATGGTCDAPLRSFKLGNTVPVKFSTTCGGVPVTGGVPPIIKIESCTGATAYQGFFFAFNNEWHFNIDSTVIRASANNAGNYKITALLPDGSQHSAVIQYKK